MPHVSDARASTHDRHDLMLVAALAADDLAGTERDQAIAQTQSCDDCRSLLDDLVSIARATALVPPPIATRTRDFRLSPAQAESLRRSGWRRLVPSAGLAAIGSRRLGVSLATFGLIGLLIGNVQLPSLAFGSAGAAPPQSATSAEAAPSAERLNASGGTALAPVPAASAAASAAAGAAASRDLGSGASAAAASAAPEGSAYAAAGPAGSEPADVSITGEGGGATAGAGAADGAGSGGATTIAATAAPSSGPNLWNVVFAIAIVVGLVLLVASRRASRPTR